MTAQAQPDQPKYLQLKQDLEEQIRSGKLRAGEQIAPERELMKLHKVSYSTVTRAMVELRNAGLIAREWGRGTFVKPHKTMVTNVALAFDQIHRPTDPYLVPIIRGVGEAAGEQGFHWQMFPLAADSIFGAEHDTLFARLLESRQIHSVLACSPFPADDMAQLAELGIPAITISNEYPTLHTPWVIEDVAQGSGDLARHLVDELGHRRFALVMGPENGILPERVRSSGLLTEELLRQLRQRGIHVPAGHIFHSSISDVDEVTAVAHRWLSESNRPTAIVCVTDTLAMEVLNVAAAMGLTVPGELSVAAWYDEVDNSPLTAVRVPLEQMGREAVGLAARAIGGELVAPSVTPVRLVVRGTTGVAMEP